VARKFLTGIDVGSQKITSLADPSASTDAANKQYVDNVARGLTWKAPVRAATTANVTVSAPGSSIDGVTLSAGDRILLKNQTTASENGIWTWSGAGTPLSRAVDADGGTEMNPGTATTVLEGTTNGDKVFMVTSDAAVTIGTTSTTWGQLGGGGTTYSAGNGINIASTTISAVATTGITVTGSGIGIDTAVVVRKYAANVGNGSSTSIALTHNLGTRDCTVQVFDLATFESVECDVVRTDTNTVTLSFATAPATSAYRAVIHA
jgi:hypothetical protein